MAEYRIVAKLDPQTAAGAASVKKDLQGIRQEAGQTAKAMEVAFDQGAQRSITALVTRLGSIETALNEVATSTKLVAESNGTLVGSIDRIATSAAKANNALNGTAAAARGTAAGNAALQSSTMRVLQAIDGEAAELAKLNALLAEARQLKQQNIITDEQLAKVEALVNQGTRGTVASVGQKRAAYQQLGFQVQDITQSFALGVPIQTIFAQQAGQTASAVGLMTNSTKGFAGFLAGPYGAIVIAATALLINFIASNVKLSSELDRAVAKLKEDARESEINRQAKEIFKTTTEGVTKAIYDQRDAFDKLTAARKTDAEQANIDAQNSLIRIRNIRDETDAIIARTKAALTESMRPTAGGEFSIPGALPGMVSAQLASLEAQQKANKTAVDIAEQNLTRSRAELAVEQANRAAAEAATPEGKISETYRVQHLQLEENLRIQILSTATITDQNQRLQQQRAYTDAMIKAETKLLQTRDAALKKAQEADRTHSDGVSKFASRQQAVGIAGRELQQRGLRVDGNYQFPNAGGGVGHHPGMGDDAHGKYAIDVNAPGNQVEANVPDLKSQFDNAARRYQARGYKVLWNGWVYSPNKSGPTYRIPAGQNQHYDHMHLEAPGTIIGKATGESTEAQAARDEAAAAKGKEERGDFVQGAVDQQATRGIPDGPQSAAARVNKFKADYQRRFNEAMPEKDQLRITKAITEGDAREIANRFDEAYVEPLKRLQALQGTTGISRQVLNAQLAESERIYGSATAGQNKLNDTQKDAIDTSIRQQDQLQREADILAQVHGPVEEYQAQIKALNGLLKEGAINQTQYNARIADLGQTARGILNDMPGTDTSGKSYQTIGAEGDEQARYDKQKADMENNRLQLLKLGINYDRLAEAAEAEHQRRLQAIRTASLSVHLQEAQSIFDSLTSIAEASAGKQSAVYKAMFIASKAFAIADSIVKIQQGIANALSLPFPANLAAVAVVAAQAASIIANIQAVKLNLADGGMVRGPGGPRDDKVQANLSNGEFVVNADATSRNRALLEAINGGSTTAGLARMNKQLPGSASLTAAGGGDSFELNFGNVIVNPAPGTTAGDGKIIGKEVKAAIESIIDDKIAQAKRGGGALTTTKTSVMTG